MFPFFSTLLQLHTTELKIALLLFLNASTSIYTINLIDSIKLCNNTASVHSIDRNLQITIKKYSAYNRPLSLNLRRELQAHQISQKFKLDVKINLIDAREVKW